VPKLEVPKEEYKSLNLDPKLNMSWAEDREDELKSELEELVFEELLSPTILDENDPNASEDFPKMEGEDRPKPLVK